jgi:outer membrane protein assembly factor BamA
MYPEPSPPEPEAPPAVPQVIIVSVSFSPANHLPQSVRANILSSIKSSPYHDDPTLAWLVELREVSLRGTLQDFGYIHATVKADARLLTATPDRHRYALTLHIDEGLQYRLGRVRFQPADPDKNPLAFPESNLRQHLHMLRGDLFNATEIRQAMLELVQLYAANGYIDMVPEPVADIDDRSRLIDLTMKIDEGPQYHVGKVEFLGLDESAQAQLKAQLHTGDPYNPYFVDEFLKQNKSLLPSDASEQDVSIHRNAKDHLVNLRFDFYSCPNNTISALAPAPH